MVPPCVKRFRQRGRPGHFHAPPKKPTTEVLPKKLKPYERFFAALLRSSPREYLDSSNSDSAAIQLWTCICQRVHLAPLYHPVESKYPDEHKHFAARAALVLEECRHAIAEGLTKRASGKPSRATVRVKCVSMHLDPDTNHTAFKFQAINKSGRSNFTKEQLFHLRPGTVMEVVSTDPPERSTVDQVLLGSVMAGNREEIEKDSSFSVMVFRPSNLPLVDKEFEVTPVAGLISELRQFEACTSKKTKKVPFLTPLLGHWPKHTRFYYSDEEDDEEEVTDEGDSYGLNDDDEQTVNSNKNKEESDDESTRNVIDDIFDALDCVSENQDHGARSDDETESIVDDLDTEDNATTMIIPELNKTQEKVATDFLSSSPGTITVVQGPPGTGKSQLLVSVICRYLMMTPIDCPPRIMVSAPTNKAVTVVAARFLKALNELDHYNAVLVGDVDKLLDAEEGEVESTSLRSIFIYSWKANIVDEYNRLCKQLTQQHTSVRNANKEVLDLAHRLHRKLVRQLPVNTKGEIASLSRKIVKTLTKQVVEEIGNENSLSATVLIKDLIEKLGKIPNDEICRELLNSANVIFCTLASAGASIFKWSAKIDDLIVDEAAATTESLLYVPFHMRPRRLLLVGDPQQLPATVMSPRAVALGYAKSLHERLMYDCKCPFTMLDVQYRMKPEISSFPSHKFYNGLIMNGDNVQCPRYSNSAEILSGRPYSFLQVDGQEQQAVCGSYRNFEEAHRVVDIVDNFHAASPAKEGNPYGADRVRIITFYRAQVVLLQQLLSRRGLPRVLVATVDSSQGCEADVVIVSFVRSNKGRGHSSRFSAGFLTDDRRVNVALTRAKFQLICVGNAQAMVTLPPDSTLFGLVANAEERKCILRERDLQVVVKSEGKRKRTASGNNRATRYHPRLKLN